MNLGVVSESDKEKYGYRPGDSTAGFIYFSGGEQTFFPLYPEAHRPDFFPRRCTVLASTAGLLLCHHPVRGGRGRNRNRAHFRYCKPSRLFHLPVYSVCNPYLPDTRRFIREPIGIHPVGAPRALIVYDRVSNRRHTGRYVFHVVCVLPSDLGPPVYTFQIYSSNTNEWRIIDPLNVGNIRENTGVSCGTRAYWLLGDRPALVFFDAADGRVGLITMPLPLRRAFLSFPLDMQLGKSGGEQVTVAVSTALFRVACVYHREYERWRCDYLEVFDSLQRARTVSRFQSRFKLQVPFWLEDRLMIWDSRWYETSDLRFVWMQGPPQRDPDADILPLVHTELDPVLHFPRFPHSLYFEPYGRPQYFADN